MRKQFNCSNTSGRCDHCSMPLSQHLTGDYYCDEHCIWTRVGDYKYKAGCKGCTFQVRMDVTDLGKCPDCGKPVKLGGERQPISGGGENG